jgi:uncharacterized protein (TIGR02246 family)
MRNSTGLLVCCGIVLAFVAATAAASEEAERKAVIDAMQGWERAVESADYEALQDYYVEGAVYYPNSTAPIVGRAAIIARNRQRGSASKVDITQMPDDVRVNGNWAVYSCLARIRVLSAGGDKEEAARVVRVLLVMEKGDDGRWRILRDIDNTTPETF